MYCALCEERLSLIDGLISVSRRRRGAIDHARSHRPENGCVYRVNLMEFAAVLKNRSDRSDPDLARRRRAQDDFFGLGPLSDSLRDADNYPGAMTCAIILQKLDTVICPI